jgi:hypothetical protein
MRARQVCGYSTHRRTLSMIGAILTCALLLITPKGHAAEAAPCDVHLIEVIMFDCPHCFKAESLRPLFNAAIAKYGGRLVVAPFPVSGSVPARELIYHSIKDDVDMERAARKAFFSAAHGAKVPLDTVVEALEWLYLMAPHIDWRRHIDLERGAKALARTERVIRRAAIERTPAFIAATSSGIVNIPVAGDLAEQVNQVGAWLNAHCAL